MKVSLRQRKKGNKITVYLDYYDKGKREYEYLGLYLTPEPEKGSLTNAQKDENKKILELAESIRSKKHLEAQNQIYGFRDKEKQKGNFLTFFEYNRKFFACIIHKHLITNLVFHVIRRSDS